MQKRLLINLIIILVSMVFMFTFTSCTGGKKATTTDSSDVAQPADPEPTPVEPEVETKEPETQQVAEPEPEPEPEQVEPETETNTTENVQEVVFENKTVYFSFDSSNLTEDAILLLREKSDWLMNNPDLKLLIEGHCDERGTTEYNIALGDRRAERTKQYLINLGISEDRLSTISYGEEKPAVDENSEKE